VFGISGTSILFYGLFVAMPLLTAAIVLLAMGRRGLKILSTGQVPPAGERVFRKTRIKRGVRAHFIGWLHVLACTPFIGIALWGLPQATALVKAKTANPSVEATNCSKLQSAAHLER
jgi:hypothetical protein